jgi:hypothetical protein
MPSYSWVCFSCEGSNEPGTEICRHCGFGATATTREITAHRGVLLGGQPSEAPVPAPQGASVESKSSEPSALIALLLFAVGVLCLVGSYQSFANGRWPVFMPPQLDLLAVPLGWLSERLGAWVGGLFAAVIGVFCVLGGLFGAKR